MAVSPEGPFALALQYARDTLVQSARFQSLTGFVGDPEGAKARCVYGRADDSDGISPARSRAILRFPDDLDIDQLGSDGWETQGNILLVLELAIPNEHIDDFQNRYLWSLNNVGMVTQELRETAGLRTAGYLNVTGIELIKFGPSNPKENANAHFAVGAFLLNYEGE